MDDDEDPVSDEKPSALVLVNHPPPPAASKNRPLRHRNPPDWLTPHAEVGYNMDDSHSDSISLSDLDESYAAPLRILIKDIQMVPPSPSTAAGIPSPSASAPSRTNKRKQDKRKPDGPAVITPTRKKGNLPLHRSVLTTTTTSPPPAICTPAICPIHTVPPLPNGDFQTWKYFLQNGGYFSVQSARGKPPKVSCISIGRQETALNFVNKILYPIGEYEYRSGWKNCQLQFHNRVKELRSEFQDAPRDLWESCLPRKSDDSYEFSALLLMLCSARTPDEKLVPVMQRLFSSHLITPKLLLEKHEVDPSFMENTLRELGMQVTNAKNVMLAAKTTLRLGRVPRNYTDIVLNYTGVGPKIALVTVHSSYGDVVSWFIAGVFIILCTLTLLCLSLSSKEYLSIVIFCLFFGHSDGLQMKRETTTPYSVKPASKAGSPSTTGES
jgi:endonuclease III